MNIIRNCFHNLFSQQTVNYHYAVQMRNVLLNKYHMNIDLLSVYHLMVQDNMISRNGLPTKTAINKGWIN